MGLLKLFSVLNTLLLISFQTSCGQSRRAAFVHLDRRTFGVHWRVWCSPAFHSLRVSCQISEFRGVCGQPVGFNPDSGGFPVGHGSPLGTGHERVLGAVELDAAGRPQWRHIPVPSGLSRKTQRPDIQHPSCHSSHCNGKNWTTEPVLRCFYSALISVVC